MNVKNYETNLPGTTIEFDFKTPGYAEELLHSVFIAGGLVLSQVSSLTGLAPHMIQNWVKRGFVSPPVGKKYTMRQFCRIATINFLKDSMQLEHIVKLIHSVNGRLDDESDDLIDDSRLYIYFTEILSSCADYGTLSEPGSVAEEVLADYCEPYSGAKARIASVLKIMAIAYASARLKQHAEVLLEGLEQG